MTPSSFPGQTAGRETSSRFARAVLALAGAGFLAGCGELADWDREYTCGGQEETRAWFPGETPDQVTHKQYTAVIDLHLRSGQVMVRTYQLPATREGQRVSFSTRAPHSWLSGQFDRQGGELSLVEERTLEIMGRSQQIRTSGQYRCKPVDTSASRTT